MSTITKYRNTIIVLTIATVIAISLIVVTSLAQLQYFRTNAYFFDTVAYQYYNAQLAERLESESVWAVAWDEFLHNDRHPLRTIPLILFIPQLLDNQQGHAVTLAVVAVILFMLFGWTILQRTRSIGYTVVGLAAFASIPMFYHINLGLGAYWLEWQASFLLCIAALCLLNAIHPESKYHERWVIGFAIAASSAMLSRYVAGFFVFVACAPLLVHYCISRYAAQRTCRSVLRPLAIVSSIIAVMVGYFAFAHFSSNRSFYDAYGYALNNGYSNSADFVFHKIYTFFLVGEFWPENLIITFAIVLCINLILGLRKTTWLHQLHLVWFAFAVPIALISLQTTAAQHTVAYAMPLIFLFAVLPVAWPKKPSSWHRYFKISSTILLGVAVVASGMMYLRNIAEHYNQVEANSEKIVNTNIAQALASVDKEEVVWNAFFDEYAIIPAMEAYYATDRLYIPAGQPFFNSGITAWQSDYPGLSPQQVARRVYQGANQWVDVAIVFGDISQARDAGWLSNEYSKAVAKYMTQYLAHDPRWEEVTVINDLYFGRLIVYYNTQARDDNYERLLHRDSSIRP